MTHILYLLRRWVTSAWESYSSFHSKMLSWEKRFLYHLSQMFQQIVVERDDKVEPLFTFTFHVGRPLGATTLSTTTLGLTTLVTLSIKTLHKNKNATLPIMLRWVSLYWVSQLDSIMLNGVIYNVVLLNVVEPSVVCFLSRSSPTLKVGGKIHILANLVQKLFITFDTTVVSGHETVMATRRC